MKDLLIVQHTHSGVQNTIVTHLEVLDVATAHSSRLLECESNAASDKDQKDKKVALETPCISLNVNGAILDSKELCFWTITGVVFQSFALLFPALATYY